MEDLTTEQRLCRIEDALSKILGELRICQMRINTNESMDEALPPTYISRMINSLNNALEAFPPILRPGALSGDPNES